MKQQSIVRHFQDDFECLKFCQALENVGGSPFSVVVTNDREFAWRVFGTVPTNDDFDLVDAEYERLRR